ncbi:MAG: hypothetical protein JWQ74_3523 [Marmoricola sp.]|nr:hypothetical protein [Marmoricola sp.]
MTETDMAASHRDEEFWSQITDDEFVAEAQRRVNRGNWSPDRYMSTQQCDDRAKLDILRTAIVKAKVASIHSGENHLALVALAVTCDQLDGVSGNPLPDRAWAVNTTFYGRAAEEEHRPEAMWCAPESIIA